MFIWHSRVLILIPFTALMSLRVCSRENEWTHTFVYSFIIETRTFFVTSDVLWFQHLKHAFMKNAFMYDMFFNSKAISWGDFLFLFFFSHVFLYSNCKILLCSKKYFLRIRDDGPWFRAKTSFWFCMHAESKTILCWNSSLVFFWISKWFVRL